MLTCYSSPQFHKDGKYDLDFKNPASNPADFLTSEQLKDKYLSFTKSYPSTIELGFLPFHRTLTLCS